MKMNELLVKICEGADFMGLTTLSQAVMNEQAMMSHGDYSEIPERTAELVALIESLKKTYGDSWGDLPCLKFLSEAQVEEIGRMTDAMMNNQPFTKKEYLL